MGRKVFLSFLGTSPYSNTQYYFDSEKKLHFESPFVQEAILKYLIEIKKFQIVPKIFLTKLAYENWNKDDGLKKCFSSIDQLFGSSDVQIPDGKSEKELLEIFLKVYDQLEKGDEVFFDITHGFRSLPMLIMVFLNYAKFLKSVSVKAIYYGAFDAKEVLENQNWAPVWDLTYFSTIQDWTNAANQFLKTGNGLFLSELIQGEKLELLKSGIENFTKEILVNRGPSIYRGETQIAIKEQIEKLDLEKNDPLVIILMKVKDHFKSYELNSVKNGLNAVKWCIDNGLIQQGATLLEEFATSYILIIIAGSEYLQDFRIRGIISAALSVSQEKYSLRSEHFPEEEKLKYLEIEKKLTPLVYGLPYYRQISDTVKKIKNSIRDDINHAGFRENPRTYDEFRNSLNKRYLELLKVIE